MVGDAEPRLTSRVQMSWDPRILTIWEFLWMLVCINLQSFCIYQRSREALNWLRHRIEVKDKSLSEPCLVISITVMYYVLCTATIERYGRKGLDIYIYIYTG